MKIHECQQGSPEWFAARLGHVTASNFSAATSDGRGSSPSKTRKDYMLKLIAEKMTGLPSESYSNKAMERGTETEQEARDYYEALNGCEVRQVGFIERDKDTGGSPDGLVGDEGMLEIKCPYPTTHIRYILADKMPADYVKQVQGNLWVAERQWCDFVSFDPRVKQRPYFCKRVYRDDDDIQELHIKIVMFIDEMKAIIEKLTASPF